MFVADFDLDLDDVTADENWWPIIAQRLGKRLKTSQKQLALAMSKVDKMRKESKQQIQATKDTQMALVGVRNVELDQLKQQLKAQEQL